MQIYETAPKLDVASNADDFGAELHIALRDFRGDTVAEKTVPAGQTASLQLPGKGYFQATAVLMSGGKALKTSQTSLVVTSPLPDDYYSTPHPAFGVWCGMSPELRRLGGAKWDRQLFFTAFQKQHLPEEYPSPEQIQSREPIKVIKCLNILHPFKRMTAVPEEQWPEIRGQVRKQVVRHRGLVDVWETQNEPMVGENFYGSMADVASIIRNTSAVVRSVDPGTPIAGICINPMSSNQYGQYLGYYKNFGIERHIDAVMLHPYIPNATNPDTSGYVETLQRLSNDLKKITGNAPPLYVSEIGYSTKPGGEVTELQQAAYLARVVLLNRRIKTLQACVWHNGLWNDAVSRRELDFGILRGHPKDSPVREPKPAFAAWATVSRLTYNADYIRDLELGRGVRVLLFQRNRQPLLVAYSLTRAKQRLKIPLGDTSALLTDMCGTEKSVDLPEGILTLEVGEDPVYVAGGDLQRFVGKDLLNVSFTPDLPEIFPGKTATITMKGSAGMWGKDARLRVEAPEDWETRIQKIQDHWTISLSAPSGSPPQEFPVFFDVRENGRSKYIWQRSVQVVAPVELVECHPARTRSGENAVTLELRRNLASAQTVQVEITENTTRMVGKAAVPGTGTVTIPLQGITHGRKNAYHAVLTLDDGYQWSVELPDIAPVVLAHQSVDLSKTLATWPKHSVYSLEGGTPSIHAVEGQKDLTRGKLYLCWDKRYLYLGARITDKFHHPAEKAASLWNGDSLQIGISVPVGSMIRPNNDGIQETTYAEFGVMQTPGQTSWVWACMNRSLMELHGPVPGLLNHSTRIGDETIYKIAIPWKTLNVAAPTAGMDLKLSVLVNDRDAGGRHWLEWYSGIAAGKEPALYGRAVLGKK